MDERGGGIVIELNRAEGARASPLVLAEEQSVGASGSSCLVYGSPDLFSGLPCVADGDSGGQDCHGILMR